MQTNPKPKYTDFSGARLLLSILCLIFVSPFLELLPNGRFVESLLITFVLFSAALVVGERRKRWFLTAILFTLAVIGRWLNHVRPDLFSNAAEFAVAMLFGVFIIVNLLSYVLRSTRVDSEVLCAAIATFLLIGIFWSFGYKIVDELIPHSFAFNSASESMKGFAAFYYSFTTLSTLGYGDITPVSNVARMLAFMEALTGMIYVSVLIARLVSMQSQGNSPSSEKDSD